VSLEEGLARTYRWIGSQLQGQRSARPAEPHPERQVVATLT
jgi:hypothetical protein